MPQKAEQADRFLHIPQGGHNFIDRRNEEHQGGDYCDFDELA